MSPSASRALGSLAPLWRALTGTQPRRAQLPIAFLPTGVGSLRRRHPSLLLTGDAQTRSRVLRGLLETELAEGPVTWLGADEAQVAALGPVVGAAARRGRLRAVAWQPQAAAALRERGNAWLLGELAACGLRRRELLVVDALAPWLDGLTPDADAADAVQQAAAAVLAWSQAHGGALLALGPTRHGQQALLPLFERSAIPCLAQLQRHGEQMHFEVTRWQDRAGTVQDLGFGLVDRADGSWQADGSGLALDTHELVTAGDAEVVLTLPDALAGATGAPPKWQVHDDLPALVAACRYTVAATVLLPYRGAAQIPALADTIRTLRAAHPHALKIVVREVGGAKLRYNQELALVRLGANTVVYGEIGFSRLMQTLVELRNQIYSRRGTDDAQALLETVAPDPVRGYLPLAAFCTAAEHMLDRTAAVGLAHCMVQLPLLPQVAHLDALAACRIGRDGDLVTADAQSVWLFLFACRAPDVEATLKRLFQQPVSDFFSQMRVRPEPDAMRRALERLRRLSVDAATDYSDVLEALQPSRLEVTPSGFVALEAHAGDTAPAPLAEPLAPAFPRVPVPFELKLR